jgi:hypothetical protein
MEKTAISSSSKGSFEVSGKKGSVPGRISEKD